MRISVVLGVVLLSLAIGACVLLGTLGWLAVGFGTLSSCTDDYSCATSGCPPCVTTQRWVNAGGVIPWVLAVVGTVVLVRGVRAARASMLLVCGLVVLTASAVSFAGTTWRAQESYCRPGTPGYDDSYCSTKA